jgi:hypothetical protein
MEFQNYEQIVMHLINAANLIKDSGERMRVDWPNMAHMRTIDQWLRRSQKEIEAARELVRREIPKRRPGTSGGTEGVGSGPA